MYEDDMNSSHSSVCYLAQWIHVNFFLTKETYVGQRVDYATGIYWKAGRE